MWGENPLYGKGAKQRRKNKSHITHLIKNLHAGLSSFIAHWNEMQQTICKSILESFTL